MRLRNSQSTVLRAGWEHTRREKWNSNWVKGSPAFTSLIFEDSVVFYADSASLNSDGYPTEWDIHT